MSRISHVLISLGKLTTNHHLDLEIPPSWSNYCYGFTEDHAQDMLYITSNTIISFHNSIMLSSSTARVMLSARKHHFMDALTQSLYQNLWLMLSSILCSRIFKLTWAFMLLSEQLYYNFQPSYLGSTIVNYHFHLTDAWYNTTKWL
jgi:hypothetical protein